MGFRAEIASVSIIKVKRQKHTFSVRYRRRKLLGEITVAHDGSFVFIPSSYVAFFPSYILDAISELLDELNYPLLNKRANHSLISNPQ